MNFKLRLVALLLLTMIMLSSCSLSLETIVQQIPFLEGVLGAQTTPNEPEGTTPTTPTETEPTVKPATLFDPETFDKKDYSTSRAELVAKYTLTQEEIDATLALLDSMVIGAMPDPEGDPNVPVMTIEEWDALYIQFEDSFYHIAQQMKIATIIYYCNMSDEVAKERYLNSMDMFYDIQDKYNESLRELYINSPMKDELFEGWSDEEIQSMLEYDPVIMEIKKAIDEFETQFDALDDSASSFTDESVEIFKQLVLKRQEFARYYKYDNYYQYASEISYLRDYSTEDLKVFRDYVIQYVVPAWDGIYSTFMGYRDLSTKRQETFLEFIQNRFDKTSKNYLLLYLNSLEGTMGESMRDVFESKNCVFSNNSNSHPTAFCTYLYEDDKPFCLFGSNGQEANTIVHEIGHYYAFLVNKDLDNLDLCETHSQGNEFLFLKFCEGQMNAAVYECVRAYNLVSTCYTMMLATIVDEFEQTVYSLDDETIANMTSEDFDAIITEICEPYGGAKWVSDNLYDPYMYWRLVTSTSPVYYISYAVSAAAAIEIYALAETDIDAAYVAYTTLVEGVTAEDGFINALKKAGIYTPFEEEAFEKIAETLKR